MALFLSVSSLLVGMILVVAPWTTLLWDANYMLPQHPAVRAVMLSAFMRGAVTGLGLVNIILALHEALRRSREASDRA